MKNKRKLKIKAVSIHDIDDRTLMLNLYFTQLLTLLIGLIFILFQSQSLIELFIWKGKWEPLIWGSGLAIVVIAMNFIFSKLIPESLQDDGGVNERIFGSLPFIKIAALSLVVAICEELLFRGAIQYLLGPYWTSILFAAIHVRYLRHWLMTAIVFLSSYRLGWIYVQTGSIWSPIIAHFLIDFIMGCIIKIQKGRDGNEQQHTS